MSTRRALHFVFKIGDRTQTIKFYKEVLGMKVLRHEEFTEQCLASCNGPYDGKWSKTMIGYGPEDNHFVVELTYNYGINNYTRGNDFLGLTIESPTVADIVRKQGLSTENDKQLSVLDPDGYKFCISSNEPTIGDPVVKVSLAVSNLSRSVKYWNELLGMTILETHQSAALLGYDASQCKLELVEINGAVNHAKAYGRIAFSCPESELLEIERKIKEAGEKVLTPVVRLDTPGKATVCVVILGDPDGHEICFVGDEAFRELSQVDPNADRLLTEAIANDKSNEWFEKKGLVKETA